MRRFAVRFLLIAIAVAALIGAGVGYWGWRTFTEPGPLGAEKVVIVAKGSGIRSVARQLESAGIVSNRTLFVLGARYLGLGRRFRAGEFAFAPGMSMREVANHLVSGEMVVRRLTVPEGLLSANVVKIVEAADGLSGDVSATPPDGRLLPETYFYSYGDDRRAVIGRMEAAMQKALDEVWRDRSPDIAIRTPEEALVLASIIERETGIDAERARISAVFHNRLRRGMRLQSDPTVAYAVTSGRQLLDRPLTSADLKVDSPYNTYENGGLPPGPVANPGRAALEAAVKPLSTNEYYFVADGTGGHAFARTLNEHNRNVARWRRLQRQKNAK
jgi:UPF0755 protein